MFATFNTNPITKRAAAVHVDLLLCGYAYRSLYVANGSFCSSRAYLCVLRIHPWALHKDHYLCLVDPCIVDMEPCVQTKDLCVCCIWISACCLWIFVCCIWICMLLWIFVLHMDICMLLWVAIHFEDQMVLLLYLCMMPKNLTIHVHTNKVSRPVFNNTPCYAKAGRKVKYPPLPHCTAIPFIYSFSGNSVASAPISTFMCL